MEQSAFTAASFATFIFFLLTLGYVAFTAVLTYHWFTYGNDKKINNLSLVVYLLLSSPLFLTMSISLLYM